MLQAELDEHLGYQKYAKVGNNSGNSRNVSYSKKVKTESLGDMELNIPRDRNAEYSPRLIPKGQRMVISWEKPSLACIPGALRSKHERFVPSDANPMQLALDIEAEASEFFEKEEVF